MTAIRKILYVALALAGATAILAACSDPAPAASTAAEQWPTAVRPTPTPGGTLTLTAPEPSDLADEAYALLDVLTTQYSPREIGSDHEMETALSLQGRLSTSGYETSLQEFGDSYTFRSSYMFHTDTPLESGVDEAILEPIRPLLSHGPSFRPPAGFVTGILTPVGDTSQMDIPERGLAGRIALIVPGAKSSDETLRRVTRAGAIGAIIIVDMEDTEAEDDITVPTTKDMDPFSTPPDPRIITVVSIGRGKGNALMELIERGEVTASIRVDVMKRPLWNVVAHMGGTEETDRSVILGAHYDTAANTQGANDNGSGVAALMTVARHIAERDHPFDVRIVLFGAEEEGLFGSRYYVDNMSQQEIDSTIAMLNFDALGSGTTLHVTGDYELTSKARKLGTDLGAPVLLQGGGPATSDHSPFEARDLGMDLGAPILLQGGGLSTSDHSPFEDAGITTMFISSNDISRINSPEDTIEHINPDLLGYAAEIGIAILDSLADETR